MTPISDVTGPFSFPGTEGLCASSDFRAESIKGVQLRTRFSIPGPFSSARTEFSNRYNAAKLIRLRMQPYRTKTKSSPLQMVLPKLSNNIIWSLYI